MSRATDIADAVVEALNDGSFSAAFTASRAYVPALDLKTAAVDEIVVTVVPNRWEPSISTRAGANAHDVAIDVAVQAKVDTAGVDDVDPVVSLMEEIVNALLREPLDLDTHTICTAADVQLFLPDHLEKYRVVTTVATLTYRRHD